MTDSALTYLHLLTPFVLSLPVLTLLRPPPKPPTELPGIRPVTIRTVTPRRAFILTLLSLLAVTAFADTAILVADLLTANGRDHSGHLEGLGLASGLMYGVGGFLVWALAAIICEWRATWGEKGMVVLGMLGLACEIPNLVLLVLRELHTCESSSQRRRNTDDTRRLRKAVHHSSPATFSIATPHRACSSGHGPFPDHPVSTR